jgi:hypothetical protein
MRDILRDLYRARSLLRRRVVSRKHVPAAPLSLKKGGIRLDTEADDVASATFLAIKGFDRFRLTASPVLCDRG